jgi:hypothetical protein
MTARLKIRTHRPESASTAPPAPVEASPASGDARASAPTSSSD